MCATGRGAQKAGWYQGRTIYRPSEDRGCVCVQRRGLWGRPKCLSKPGCRSYWTLQFALHQLVPDYIPVLLLRGGSSFSFLKLRQDAGVCGREMVHLDSIVCPSYMAKYVLAWQSILGIGIKPRCVLLLNLASCPEDVFSSCSE